MSRVPSFAAIKTSHSMLNVSHTGAMAHAASGDLDGHPAPNPWPAAAAEGVSAADAATPENGASPTATGAERMMSSGACQTLCTASQRSARLRSGFVAVAFRSGRCSIVPSASAAVHAPAEPVLNSLRPSVAGRLLLMTTAA